MIQNDTLRCKHNFQLKNPVDTRLVPSNFRRKPRQRFTHLTCDNVRAWVHKRIEARSRSEQSTKGIHCD